MKLKILQYIFFLAVVILMHHNYAQGQDVTDAENDCVNHISIHGSSNVNRFQLINHNPKILRLSNRDNDNKPYQRIEIAANDFKGDNDRMRKDFLEMVNASEYPFITLDIESRSLKECRKKKETRDFKTIITIAGVSNSYVVPCKLDSCRSSGYMLKGNLKVKLTDFGIDPPQKFFGIIKVNNEVLIDYVFRFQPDDAIFRSALNEKPDFQRLTTS